MTKSNTDWARLAQMTDEDIQRGIDSDPDASETPPEFWKNARLILPPPVIIANVKIFGAF